jgi:hypothetical protein
MSIPGFYTQQQFDEALREGRMKRVITGVVIGLAIGISSTAFFCYRSYGPTAQVPNLSLLIGDLQRVKDDLEWIAASTKSRRDSYIITEPQILEAADRYSDLASRFNGICATLEAMLSTGHDENSVEAMQMRLSEAQKKHQEFRKWFEALPRVMRSTPTEPNRELNSTSYIGDALAPFVELGKHFFDAMKEMDKIKRESLIVMLQKLRFKPWPS